jgi:hypothetical protein
MALVGADHLDAVLVQHAVAVQVERAVQRRLPPMSAAWASEPLLGDDLLDTCR